MFHSMIMERFSLALSLITVCWSVQGAKAAAEDVHFTADNSCPGRVVHSLHCPHTVQAPSLIMCATRCSQQADCVTFIRDTGTGECQLCNAVPVADCANTVSNGRKAYRMVVRPDSCQNGGTYESSLRRCVCPTGSAGDWCQRPPFDCREASQLGYPTGVYNIQPARATKSFRVFCRNIYGGRTHVSAHTWTSFHLNRNWQKYRNGFGNPSGDHWTGLENVYLLTNSGLKYILKMEPWLENNTYFQQRYHGFRISDEADKYRLHYDFSTENTGRPAGDCLARSLGAPFSTYDADNDGDVMVNCAQLHGSGWWFPEGDCSLTRCNPNGKLVHNPGSNWSGEPDDVFWQDDLGNVAVWKIMMWLQRD